MPKQQTKYDPQFKRDALRLVERGDRSLNAVARDLGIPQKTLWAWYYIEMGKKGKPGPGSKVVGKASAPETPQETIARLEREVSELKRKNAALEMDRAILKKAAAFFAKESE